MLPRPVLDTLRRSTSGDVLIWLFTAAFAVACGAAAAAAAPLALKHLVDAAPKSTSMAVLAPLSAYAGALLIQRLFEQLQTYAYSRGEAALIRRFSTTACEHLLRLPLATHLERRSGALAQALIEGIAGLRLVLTHTVVTALPVVVQLTVGGAILARELGGGAAAALLAALLAYAVTFALTVRRLDGPLRRFSERNLEAGAVLSDGLLNVEAIKAFTAEQGYARRYGTELAAAERHWRSFLRRRVEGGAVAALVFSAIVVASTGLAAADVARGAMSAGELVMISAYVLQITRPIEMLGFAARDIGQGRAQFGALSNLLRLPIEPSATSTERPPLEGADLSFEDVDLGFTAGRLALESISFRVRPGETLVLVGPSGGGKSSIVRLALGFQQPDRGLIRLDGRPLSEIGLAALRRQIALVGQDPVLLNDSLAANIALGAEDATPGAIAEAVKAARLSGLLATLPDGLDTPVGERGLKLSGGERQRVALARALLRPARLLVLDEATAALDAGTESELWRALAVTGRSITKIIVTHRLGPARQADRILVIDQGRIVEDGRHDALMLQRGLYWRLWGRQAADA